MATIERRLADLEQAGAGYVGPLVLRVYEDMCTGERAPLTAEQERQVEEAEGVGRRVIILVRRFITPAAEQEAQ